MGRRFKRTLQRKSKSKRAAALLALKKVNLVFQKRSFAKKPKPKKILKSKSNVKRIKRNKSEPKLKITSNNPKLPTTKLKKCSCGAKSKCINKEKNLWMPFIQSCKKCKIPFCIQCGGPRQCSNCSKSGCQKCPFQYSNWIFCCTKLSKTIINSGGDTFRY